MGWHNFRVGIFSDPAPHARKLSAKIQVIETDSTFSRRRATLSGKPDPEFTTNSTSTTGNPCAASERRLAAGDQGALRKSAHLHTGRTASAPGEDPELAAQMRRVLVGTRRVAGIPFLRTGEAGETLAQRQGGCFSLRRYLRRTPFAGGVEPPPAPCSPTI